MEKYKKFIDTPIGRVKVCSDGKYITRLAVCDEGKDLSCPVLEECSKQILEYFNGSRKHFDLPLNLIGSPFQMRVWKALCEIPYGEVCSYKEIAEKIESPKAMRAVGMANHHNPIMIIVPCHRVIGANGSLVGFGGGLPMKKALLDLECKYK